MIDVIRAFEGGGCSQLLAMVDRRSWRLVRFPAVFLALHHRREGWIVVDTGYGGRFHAATRGFPARFYRWATPTREAGTVRSALGTAKIRIEDVRHVIVTHFHGDHVGGLAEFPHATIHHHEDALQPLQSLSPFRQIHAAFLAALVPDWLPERTALVRRAHFTPSRDRRDASLPVFDLFGDGCLSLVDLPGHAPGQLGVLLQTSTRRVLYAADAYWRMCQLDAGVEPLGVAMRFQWDRHAYRRTVNLLRTVRGRGAHDVFACHDEGTAARLNALSIA